VDCTARRLLILAALLLTSVAAAQAEAPEKKWKYVGTLAFPTLTIARSAPVLTLTRSGAMTFEGTSLTTVGELETVLATYVRKEKVTRIALTLEQDVPAVRFAEGTAPVKGD
jgi:hypothetical protein